MRNALIIAMLLILLPRSAGAVDPEDVRVESIDFYGNEQYSDEQLKDLMAVRTSGLIRRSFYNPQVFQDDLRNIRQFYVEQGYLEAEIANVQIDSTENVFAIDITISEGERTYVEEVTVSGNTVFSDEQMLRQIPLEKGDPFRSPLVQEGITSIMTIYGREGYINVAVKPEIRINPDIHRAIVDFNILEGQQYRVEDIRIMGLEKTEPVVVEREIPLEEGDIFDYSEILRAEQNLYATGLFNSVIVQPAPAPGDSSKRVILVRVRERQTGEFAIGGGYETIDGFRGTLDVRNNNLLGTARQAGFYGQLSQAGYRTRLSYVQPWTFGVRLRTDANGLFEFREEPGYDIRRIGGNLVFSRRIRPYTDASITYRFESIKIDNIQTETIPDDLQKGNLRSLALGVIYDSRDDIFNTHDGAYIETRNELVGLFLGGTDNFLTTILSAKRFIPLGGRNVLGGALQVGWKGLFRTTREIPLSERFYTGGPNSVRGFEYQALGPADPQDVPLGGRFLLVGNLEWRTRIISIIGMAVFLDAGNVWGSPGEFRFDQIRYSAGLGPRVNTPFGVIRTDFAFKLDRREGEKLNEFWFALGQAF